MVTDKGIWPFSIKYALIAAVFYCILCLIFFTYTDFRQLWILYIGNALFLGVMVVAILALNKNYGGNATTNSLMMTGHIITFIGVIAAALVTFVIMLIYVPEVFQKEPVGQLLERRPANSGTLLFATTLSVLVGNFSAGSFASIIIPYVTKRNQQTERGEEVIQIVDENKNY